jgi:hypothetical protein
VSEEPKDLDLQNEKPEPLKCQTEGCNQILVRKGPGRIPKYCTFCKKDRHKESSLDSYYHRVAAKNETKEEFASGYESRVELSDDEIRKILIDKRGLQNNHVIETVIDLGKLACEMNQFTSNEFFWMNGFGKFKESIESDEPRLLDPVSDEQAKGMVITLRDMFALFDYGVSWRDIKWPLDTFEEFRNLDWDFSSLIERFTQKKGKRITFDEFHGLRYCSIVDSLWSGRWIHGLDFWPKPHGEWRDFFPKKVPSLPLEYGMEDIKTWFKGLTDGPRRFLLVASRNSYKSTWQLYSEALPYVLACPDVTILEISAVASLSRKFVKKFRQLWTVADKRNPNLFNMIWPEMMISAGDRSDANVFDCPMKKNLYPQNTVAFSAVGATQVGERCLLQIFDDAASEENENTDELKEGLIEKIELIEKLKEPVGIEILIGTPKAAVGDLYKTIIEKSAKTNHKHLDYVINPAWTLKPEAESKSIHDIVEEDVASLLFPSRMDFDFLKAEL